MKKQLKALDVDSTSLCSWPGVQCRTFKWVGSHELEVGRSFWSLYCLLAMITIFKLTTQHFPLQVLLEFPVLWFKRNVHILGLLHSSSCEYSPNCGERHNQPSSWVDQAERLKCTVSHLLILWMFMCSGRCCGCTGPFPPWLNWRHFNLSKKRARRSDWRMTDPLACSQKRASSRGFWSFS